MNAPLRDTKGQTRLPLEAPPRELRKLQRWVAWGYEERKGKPTKVPYFTATRGADTTSPETWLSYRSACALAEREGFAGVGFVLAPPYVGVDLDGCRNPESGELAPWARKIVDRLDAYTEISPSGTGLHILLRARVPNGARKKRTLEGMAGGKQAAVEVYAAGRYFAFTGNVFEERR